MPPARLGRDFKTIKVRCHNGHEVARYRKPKSEWGQRTHKLYLVSERIVRLTTEPPLFLPEELDIVDPLPPNDTPIICGDPECDLGIGKIDMVHGTVALVLNHGNLQPTKG